MRATLTLAFAAVLALGGPAVAADAPGDYRALYQSGDWALARPRLEARLKQAPGDLEARYLLAAIHWRLQDYAAAAAHYRVLSARDPKGSYGREARSWLLSYGHLALPKARASFRKQPPRQRARAGGPRPAPQPPSQVIHFRSADGTFAFAPPAGFELAHEESDGLGTRLRFAPPRDKATSLTVAWRLSEELAYMRPDQRVARERQLLLAAAAGTGARVRAGAHGEGPCLHLEKREGAWASTGLLFFRGGRLYELTARMPASRLSAWRKPIQASWDSATYAP